MQEKEFTMRLALYEVLKRELEARPNLIVMGEDIREYGGAFGVTRDLYTHFPSRVINVPISENSYVGVAAGAAMNGLRVVVELMFMDFITLAMDQIVNHATKVAYMYAGQLSVPIVIRTPFGARRGYGPSHSQMLESWFMNIPGLKVVVPSGPRSAAQLLRASIMDDSPVLFLEHKLLYDSKEPMGEEDFDVPFPIGKGRLVREGEDVTVITYGFGTVLAREAATRLAQAGVSIEIVDMLSLKPYDKDLIFESVGKTGKAVFVEEGVRTGGVGGEVMAEIAEGCIEVLDGRLVRVGAADLPIPASRPAEDMVLPSVNDIIRGVKKAQEF